MDYKEETIKSEKIFSGRVVNLRVDTVRLPNGNTSTREIIEHSGGVGVIPITKDREVIMVKQYRKPIEKVSLEIPAGKLDYGEDPYECGVRELEEETGYKTHNIQSLGKFYSTPGFTNEILYLYMATDLYEGKVHLDEDEFLNTERIPLDILYNMALKGELEDAKSIIAIIRAYHLS